MVSEIMRNDLSKVLKAIAVVTPVVGLLTMPTLASAETVDLVTAGAGITYAIQAGGSLNGGVISISALSYAADYVTFDVSPNNTTATVALNFQSNASYPGGHFEVLDDSTNAFLIIPTPISTTSTVYDLTLDTGVDYTIQFKSTGAPDSCSALPCAGNLSFTISPTPIPGALALLAGGLGMLGFGGLFKRRRTVAA
jgi:hypothetical protein